MNPLQGVSSLGARLAQLAAERAARRAAESEPEPEPAAPMPVSRPVGESGTFIRSLGRHNSFLRMFAMEASHLPAQLRRVGGLHRVIGQDVSIKVQVLPGGTPVAVAGSARTDARASDGSISRLRELAYVSVLRRFITNSASVALGVGTQSAPPVERTTDSLLSAVQIIRDRRLLGRTATNPLAGLLRSVSPRALEPAASALSGAAEALADLELAFSRLARRESFTEVSAASSSPLFLAARARPGANPGSFEVEVLQTAQGHTAETDQAADGPMGLAGSFKLGGVEVEVEAGDALFDLVAKINFGEDLDKDSQLDPGEDQDGDFRLDGGTAEHGVRASFYEGRLRLRRAEAGAGDIQVEDADGILQAIGLVERDELGQLEFKNEVSAARPAVIKVDGAEFRSDDGTFEGAGRGVELSVTGQPGRAVTVTVAPDASGALDELRAAVSEFNSAVRSMNALLDVRGGLLARDPAATRVRAGLIRAVLAPVEGQPEDLDEAPEAGLARAARRRVGLGEEQLASAARRTRAGPGRPDLDRVQSPPSAFNVLNELGITAAEDDTLDIDEGRFARVLAERQSEVADLFAGAEEGIAVRVLARVGTALGPSGLLELRRRAIEALSGLGIGRSFAEALQETQRARLLAGALPPVGA